MDRRRLRTGPFKAPNSSGRPVENSSAEHVDVKMVHGLSCPSAVIDHRAVACAFKSALARHAGRNDEKVAEQRPILRRDVAECHPMLAGNDQKMNGRLRANVFKREDPFVLVDDARGCFAVCNAAKNAVFQISDRSAWFNSSGRQRFATQRPKRPTAAQAVAPDIRC